jgi:hypothetical protein
VHRGNRPTPKLDHLAYPKCVAETVRRLGGFVAKYMGDGTRLLWLEADRLH